MSKKIQEIVAEIEAAYKKIDELRAEVQEFVKNCPADKFTPESVEWVDLGLPSGRLWANENAEGHFTHEEALAWFGDFLPTATAMAELYENCDWEWDSEKKGYIVTGPNGNSIFLPTAGYKDSDGDLNSVGSVGEYWTSCPSKTSQTRARNLYFDSGNISPLTYYYRSYGFSVRPSRENF